MSKGTSMTSFGLSRPVPVFRGLIDCGAIIAREAMSKCIFVKSVTHTIALFRSRISNSPLASPTLRGFCGSEVKEKGATPSSCAGGGGGGGGGGCVP